MNPTRSESGYRFRRRDLLRWLKERPEHQGLTTKQIVDVSGIYDGNGRWDRCRSDLLALARNGLVKHDHSTPTRWFA